MAWKNILTSNLSNGSIKMDKKISDISVSGFVVTGKNGVTSSFNFGTLFYYDPSDTKWYPADANEDAKLEGKQLGIVADAAIYTLSNAHFLLYGLARYDTWNWTEDDAASLLYASITSGEMSQTAPSANADRVRIVGNIINDDFIFFNPDNTAIKYKT